MNNEDGYLFPCARLLALGAALLLPACGGSGATPVSRPGLLWNSQAGSGLTASGGEPVSWVDPNTGLGSQPISPTGPIQSADVATYTRYNISNRPPPFNLFISYIFNLEHPLATDTSSSIITSREETLQGYINAFRHSGTNPISLGGVIPVGGAGAGIVPSFAKGTMCARAHCKHYAYHHPTPMPGEQYNTHPPLPANNFIAGNPWLFSGLVPATDPPPQYTRPPTNYEGDHVLWTAAGSPADMSKVPNMVTSSKPGAAPLNPLANHGRLGKIGVAAAPVVGEFSYSGVAYAEPDAVFNQMLIDDAGLIQMGLWTHVVVGHWRGGTRSYYWNILFLKNPTPAN